VNALAAGVPQMIEGAIVRTVIQSQLTIDNIEGEI
jgi:hypothetical protein